MREMRDAADFGGFLVTRSLALARSLSLSVSRSRSRSPPLSVKDLGPQDQKHRPGQHRDDRARDGPVGGRAAGHRTQQAASGAQRIVRAGQRVRRVRDRLALAVQVGEDGDAQFLRRRGGERREWDRRDGAGTGGWGVL